jgi:hypothetical protein
LFSSFWLLRISAVAVAEEDVVGREGEHLQDNRVVVMCLYHQCLQLRGEVDQKKEPSMGTCLRRNTKRRSHINIRGLRAASHM